MKKILFIHHAAGWGGAPNCLINLINNLDHSNYKAEVLLLKDSVVSVKLAENGITYKVAKSVFYKKYYQFFAHSEAGYLKWFQIYSFLKLSIYWILSRYIFAKKELGNVKFDIIHLNSSVLTDWLAPSKSIGKVVIHIREPFRKGKFDILHYFFRHEIVKYADQIIAISKDNAKRIDIPAKTEVIYDYSEVPVNAPSESSYSSNKVLYLGGSSTSKGFYILVEALDYLDKNVVVCFGGHYASSINSSNKLIKLVKLIFSKEKKRTAAIQKIKNHPNAMLIGLIYNVKDYLEEVCCLVSPFFVPHFAMPVIEAHLNRKPVIGSNVEGMEEIIAHEKNGIIVPKNNPKAFADAINELTSNSQKAKTFGQTGYDIAIQKFTPKNIIHFEHIYDQL